MGNFEQKHVHSFYSESSAEFSATRYKIWPKVAEFYEKYVKETDLILDAGAGNGRNTCYPERTLSLDYSENLLVIAKTRQLGLGYGRCDLGEDLGVVNSVFDIVISVAVIHHLSTAERREKSVRSLVDVLKPGGYMLVYVWSECPESKPTKFLGITNLAAGLDPEIVAKATANDVFVSWKKTNQKNRYYHLFRDQELNEMVLQSKVKIVESGRDHGNYYVICQKLFGI
ncbi:tRNA (uracil-5-)-methyltransferase TRM9 [Nematocida homosporus]|uniref:tRNA (uracil-5-)-methyltransferase TRM9 n=1 Tax=Nematocida homosporus TaxID=1912981 RepID=UPI002220F99A|nr:tRNA (uracil-5-)-methyltransferase TRM9 [Nematocida homosporus]KAI5186972.1 tRNA (uracil-5-)-methyltransferase TRM9 [Nematocida homosporus]